jgi:hypothetical protein
MSGLLYKAYKIKYMYKTRGRATSTWCILNLMKDDIFHILNRGVEKRKVFLNNKDYLRFANNLNGFNTVKNVRSYSERCNKNVDVARPLSEELVDVLCWSLMPNHPHILVLEKDDNNAGKFSRKVFDGYTKYFNKINDRSGVLFQGRTKIIPIQRDSHFLWIPFYIMANPLDLFQLDWRENGIKNPKKAFEFLINYRWSSLQDLVGKNNFPDIVNKKLFYELYNTNEKDFKREFMQWLEEFKGGYDLDE